ncbi:MAG: DUF423 domain-containing protein [Bacteroidetes bacterium]|nr:DUF423 domain-containing protein [Bacteroidota bacterium]
MKNIFSFIAGLLGATGVAFGALGAHALKQKMQEGIITAEQLSAFDTATKYQLVHALVLLLVAYINRDRKNKLYNRASYFLVSGVLCFSGSIYLLSTQNISGIHAGMILGPLTPIGGLLLISAWVCITIEAAKKHES